MVFLSVVDNVIHRNYLEEIYHLYKKELLYIANGILNDYYEAEDVVHTAFIKFADYITEDMDIYSHKTKGLIVIIVRNLSLNIYKSRKNKKEVNIDDLAGILQSDSNVSPELNILRLDLRYEIAKKLAEINPSYADILTLRYTYEFSDLEIASILTISEANVRKRLSRARKSLKIIMKGCENYEWT